MKEKNKARVLKHISKWRRIYEAFKRFQLIFEEKGPEKNPNKVK